MFCSLQVKIAKASGTALVQLSAEFKSTHSPEIIPFSKQAFGYFKTCGSLH